MNRSRPDNTAPPSEKPRELAHETEADARAKKSRQQRFEESQAKLLALYAETFSRLAE